MSTPFTIRWGILATGWIAEQFVHDLLLDPATRSVEDVKHEITAVSSSSSLDRAKEFITNNRISSSCTAYASYEELVKDTNVDIVYIATPHSHHFQNAMLCLKTGNKHVLCEKSFTTNAAQAEILIQTAKEKGLFLMEAVWTRFFPISRQIRGMIENGEIGDVRRVIADDSFGDDCEKRWGTKHRMVNMDLAGGALLDLGVYSLTWVFQTLYHTLPSTSRQPPSKVSSIMTKYPSTGADESTTIIMQFPNSPPNSTAAPAQAVAMTSIRVSTDPDERNTARPGIRIQGTKAEIAVDGPAFRPLSYRIIYKKEDGGPDAPEAEEVSVPMPGGAKGFCFEADEVARCIRDGKTESEGLPLSETLEVLRVMDAVRGENGLFYPAEVESTVWPLEMKAKA